MSDKDIPNMLFLPGLFTTKKVFNTPGREVGIDVAKASVETIGDTMDVESEPGHGSTWWTCIPLTLAIQPSLITESHGELYAILQVLLLELVALDSSHKETPMKYASVSLAYRLHGMLLPLIRLNHVLYPERTERYDREANGVVVVPQNNNQRFGPVVDKVINSEGIMVELLPSKLKPIGLYAGAILLGDGHAVSILDIRAAARHSLTGASTQAIQKVQAAAEATQARVLDVIGRAPVVGIGDRHHAVIPLAAITRLEHANAEKVERAGGHETIQYRGRILPIVRLNRLLRVMDYEELKNLQVVMYNRGNRPVATIVREALDIVSDDRCKHSTVEDCGLLGSAVLKDRVIELLDMEQAVRAANPTFFNGIGDFNTELELGFRLDMVRM